LKEKNKKGSSNPGPSADVDSLTDGEKKEHSAYRISEENPFSAGKKKLVFGVTI
jgi:hypothetical protein